MKNIVDLNNVKLIPQPNGGKTNFIAFINNELYYVKTTLYIYKELVISEFCRLIGIPCVTYQLAIKDKKHYLISKSYKPNDCKCLSGDDLLQYFLKNTSDDDLENLNIANKTSSQINNLETIWLALTTKYGSDISKSQDIRDVMLSLLEQYFFMILIQDLDFHNKNWEIIESKDHIWLSPKYDNESAFGMEIFGISMGVDNDDPLHETTNSLNYFLDLTAKEDNELFRKLYSKATPELFAKAIDNVNKEYDLEKIQDADDMLYLYQEQYNRLKQLIKDKGLLK